MTTETDEQGSARLKRGLLSSLREVLFDNTPQSSVEVSTGLAVAEEPRAAEFEAALSVLRAAVEAQLGSGVREFSLQNEALSEALPDAVARRRAALRVLALKGISREQLRLELEAALAALGAQGDAFTRKLRDKRAALAESQRECLERAALDTATAEQTIVRLQAELDVQRQAIGETLAHRDQQSAECEATLAELGARERGFQRAFHAVDDEYRTLETQLSQELL